MNIYEKCPAVENKRFLLRMVERKDCEKLLKVYSDEKAVPLFNSDNCHGDDFHYQTLHRMAQAIEFWLFSYREKYFVRWSIIDKANCEIAGTVEMFRREAEDAFTNTALLRLDLRSDYEETSIIEEILALLIEHAYEWFDCDSITTKAPEHALKRRTALAKLNFAESTNTLKGHNGERYAGYFVHPQNA